MHFNIRSRLSQAIWCGQKAMSGRKISESAGWRSLSTQKPTSDVRSSAASVLEILFGSKSCLCKEISVHTTFRQCAAFAYTDCLLREFLTGFHKRKVKRRKAALQ